MKLFEIAPERLTTLDMKKRKWDEEMMNKVRARQSDPEHEYIGSGSFAYVSKQTNLMDMDRIQKMSHQLDGGIVYLTRIASSPMLQDNPVAPKILSVDNSDPKYPTFHIEPLKEFDTPKIKDNDVQLEALAKQYFTEMDPKYSKAPIHIRILDTLRLAITRNPALIKDKRLLQLVNVIRDVKNSYAELGDFRYDIRHENVMWRLTAQGPQLVITDPIANFNIGR